MEQLRPNDQRAKVAIMLLWVVLIFEVFSLLSDYFQYELLNRMVSGGEFSIEEADSNDNRQQIIAIFFIIAMIVSIATFIQWFRRAYFNLRVRSGNTKYTVDDALWCWFIPILNFFRPYNIMDDMYERTDKLFYEKKPREKSPLNHQLMGLWWGFWIISRIIAQISTRYAVKAEGAEEIINSTVFTMVGSVLGIVGGLLAIAVVKNYSHMENLLIDNDSEAPNLKNDIDIIPIDPALP